MNQGRMEEGIAAFQGISREDAKLYAEGVFKIGKAYKLMEEYEKLRDHMAEFKADYPRNPRVAEAIFWMGWTYRQQGMPGKARDVYWEAISEYGDDLLSGPWTIYSRRSRNFTRVTRDRLNSPRALVIYAWKRSGRARKRLRRAHCGHRPPR